MAQMKNNWIEILDAKLDVEAVSKTVADVSAGGIDIFIGTTRAEKHADGRDLIALDYEAYEEMALSQMAGRQLPLFSLLVPAWLVMTMAGWRGMRGVWPALVVCGGSFAAVQFLVSNYIGPALVDVAGGLFSLVALALFLRVWKPAQTWQFADEVGRPLARKVQTYSRGQVVHAWVPWLLLSVLVFLCGEPHVKSWLNGVSSPKFAQAVALDIRDFRPEDAYFNLAPGEERRVRLRFNQLGLRVRPRKSST